MIKTMLDVRSVSLAGEMGKERALIISDTQLPYEHNDALKFVTYLKNHFKIPDENCFHVGDEADQFHGGIYPKGADYEHTPKEELRVAVEKFQDWYAVFPQMKVATSNHMLRWLKKASNAEIPSQLLRKWEDVIEAPPGWKWADRWVSETKHRFQVLHGMEYSGVNAARFAATHESISTAFGHLHSVAGISRIRTGSGERWGMATACLIDEVAYAFKYGKWNRFRPVLGAGVVLDGGNNPIWLPL